jgi:hypothetical protein
LKQTAPSAEKNVHDVLPHNAVIVPLIKHHFCIAALQINCFIAIFFSPLFLLVSSTFSLAFSFSYNNQEAAAI